jgi:hypothetical protein
MAEAFAVSGPVRSEKLLTSMNLQGVAGIRVKTQ